MSDVNETFDIEQPKDENLVEVVRSACEEAAELTEIIKGYEEAASAAKKRLFALTTIEIPTAMAEAGLGDTFSLATGHKIKIFPFVNGSLPKDPEKRSNAFKILEKMGASSLIKSVVSLGFAKGEKEVANSLVENLQAQGFDVSFKEDVHTSSLKAFIKEKMSDGSEIDLDALGLYTGSVAKITPPKQEK
jgi:hypothetical protein